MVLGCLVVLFNCFLDCLKIFLLIVFVEGLGGGLSVFFLVGVVVWVWLSVVLLFCIGLSGFKGFCEENVESE
jgi:hypothetical protein